MNTATDAAFNALSGLGSAWRGDWSDFDGRTLRDQLDSWASLMRAALAGEPIDADEWLRMHGICPVCRGWCEWCNDREGHWPVRAAAEGETR